MTCRFDLNGFVQNSKSIIISYSVDSEVSAAVVVVVAVVVGTAVVPASMSLSTYIEMASS
jgi:hypothetical protein